MTADEAGGSAGASSEGFYDALFGEEKELLAELTAALAGAAETMAAIDDPDERAAAQDRNRAAFAAATALAGRRAAATLRDGVAKALAALDAAGDPDRTDAGSVSRATEPAADGVAALSATLRSERRAAVLGDVERLTAALEAAMRRDGVSEFGADEFKES